MGREREQAKIIAVGYLAEDHLDYEPCSIANRSELVGRDVVRQGQARPRRAA